MQEIRDMGDLKSVIGRIGMGDREFVLTDVLSALAESHEPVNSDTIKEIIKKRFGVIPETATAMDIISRGGLLRNIQWGDGSGYIIGDEFTDLPVILEDNRHASVIMASEEVRDFEAKNPDYKRVRLTGYLEKNFSL